MNELLSEDDIVACFSTRDEAGLEGMYEIDRPGEVLISETRS